jgi:hypothetical protein
VSAAVEGPNAWPRRTTSQLAYQAIRIEGGLIPADELTRLTTLQTPDKTEQTESHYGVPKGLKLRDEIARFWRIAQNLWADFQPLRLRQDVNAHDVTVREFLVPLLRDVLGFTDITSGASVAASGHTYNIGHAARGGRLPVIVAAHNQGLDEAADRFGEINPETNRVRRRSPFMMAQEALNASDQSLWALVSNGLTLRILRDNPSLTRPAYVEVDLEALFSEELYADFTAFWLLAHASRFGRANAEPSDCPWERWRSAGQEAGVRARDRLRDGVAEALRALGTGFLAPLCQLGFAVRIAGSERHTRAVATRILRTTAEPGLPLHLPGDRGGSHRHGHWPALDLCARHPRAGAPTVHGGLLTDGSARSGGQTQRP